MEYSRLQPQQNISTKQRTSSSNQVSTWGLTDKDPAHVAENIAGTTTPKCETWEEKNATSASARSASTRQHWHLDSSTRAASRSFPTENKHQHQKKKVGNTSVSFSFLLSSLPLHHQLLCWTAQKVYSLFLFKPPPKYINTHAWRQRNPVKLFCCLNKSQIFAKQSDLVRSEVCSTASALNNW